MATVLNVIISSNLSEFPTEKRFDPNIKVAELKKKLELITGANHKSMKLSMTVDDKQVGQLENDDETLSKYVGETVSKDSTIKIDVKDEQPIDLMGGDVPKYTISDEKYQERPNNVRNFIKEMREKNKE